MNNFSILIFISFSNFADNSFNSEKQSKDEDDNNASESDTRKLSESLDNNGGSSGIDESNETPTKSTSNPNKNDERERTLPRIQIKSPSKLAQEFNDKQKQSDTMLASNDSNRTNDKAMSDSNTTPLYDEPTENRSYSINDTTSTNQSHTFNTEISSSISSSTSSFIQQSQEISADLSADQ